jgi:hypothetical protein
MRTGCLGLKTNTWDGLAKIIKLAMLQNVSPLRSSLFTLPSSPLFPISWFWVLTSILENLDKSKITGIKQVDQIQDDVNNLVANQVGPNGLLAPIGNMVSKEGINRAERGGKDDKGTYGGPAAGYSDPVIKNAQSAGQGMMGGAQKVGGGVTDGVKGAGGYVGGLFGGGKKWGDEV